MHREQSERDVVGPIAYAEWGTITPVARVATRTFRWKNLAFFRSSARPLQVEVVANGRRQVVDITHVESHILGALSLFLGVVTLAVTWLRRSK